MQNSNRTFVAVVWVFAVLFGGSFANGQLPVIELSALSRSGGQISSEFDLRITSGKLLDDVKELMFSHPGIKADFISDQSFRISIANDIKPGRYEVRALGRYGLSNPRSFLVTTLLNVAPDAVSHDAAKPTPIALNTIYHARSVAEQIDYYSLHLEAGDSVQVDLISQRVDSQMVGKITRLEKVDQLSQSARGTDYVDPQLTFTATHSGDYVVRVHDFVFGGGDDYFYQLSVQTQAAAIDLLGTPAASGEVPQYSLPESFTLLNQPASPSIQVDESPSPLAIVPPCILAARFDEDDDDDVYLFDAQAGETFAIELQSQRLGQPTDVRIEVERAEAQPTGEPVWQPVVSHDESQEISDVAVPVLTRDPAFNFEAPATGSYRLLVRDLDNGSSLGRTQEYRLLLRRPNPDFALLTYVPASINDPSKSQPPGTCLLRGGTQAIKVLLVRRDGWSGAVNVRVEGLPDHVNCQSVTIAANQNQVHLVLVADDLVDQWTGRIRIVGMASIEPGKDDVQHDAIPATITWGRDVSHDFVRSRLCSELSIGVSTLETMPISIDFGTNELIKLKAGESAPFPVKLTRREGGKQSCVLRPRDLPPGVTVAEATIATDKDDGQMDLKVAPDAAAGIYSFWLQAETKLKLASQAQELNVFVASPTVTIEIIKP